MREYTRNGHNVQDRPAGSRCPAIIYPASHGMSLQRHSVAIRLLTAALILSSSACGRLNARTAPAPNEALPPVLATARGFAASGRWDSADSTLSSFAAMFPGTSEAVETDYYRALFKMDPSNAHASLAAAMASLDAYLADRGPRQHVVEATTLRRVAAEVNGLSHTANSALAQAKDATNVAKDAKAEAADAKDAVAKASEAPAPTADAEIKHLKDELAKANAELDRFRKRLATPPGKPPAR